jgi:hypothetical protein
LYEIFCSEAEFISCFRALNYTQLFKPQSAGIEGAENNVFMLIFNTTYLVPDKVYGKWIKWIREENIPYMLQSGYFEKPQIAKVYSNEEQEGESFSVQFHVAGLDELEQWHLKYATEFQTNFKAKFAEEVMFFATILEIMDL